MDILLANTDFTYVSELPLGYRIIVKDIPELLVNGTRSFNADIRRKEDDARPYIVLDREQLQQSSAPNIGAALRSLLPGVVPEVSPAGAVSISGTGGGIHLRGPAGQTLILIDGRRVVAPSISGDFVQPDLEMIAVSAVDRVEVHPPGSSAQHGASAVAAVVNIILRHGEPGSRADGTCGETLLALRRDRRISGARRRSRARKGGSRSPGPLMKRDSVWLEDWDTLWRAGSALRATIRPPVEAYPIPVVGDLWNVRTLDGRPLLPGGTSAFAFLPRDFRSE